MKMCFKNELITLNIFFETNPAQAFTLTSSYSLTIKLPMVRSPMLYSFIYIYKSIKKYTL